jgi:hypothetical protein
VVFEVGTSLVLLVGAGLLMTSFVKTHDGRHGLRAGEAAHCTDSVLTRAI